MKSKSTHWAASFRHSNDRPTVLSLKSAKIQAVHENATHLNSIQDVLKTADTLSRTNQVEERGNISFAMMCASDEISLR